MWCTRWFLPLLLLPLPTAPPYFLLLFLISLTMHAKPCFYCIVLLTTLFLSSCYWQPFPLDSPLSTPWAENITTFAEALNVTITPSYSKPFPDVMRAVDRCWCDFSASGFFEPFNVSHWEHVSIQRLKDDLERPKMAEQKSAVVAGGTKQALSVPATQTSAMPRTAAPAPSVHIKTTSYSYGSILSIFGRRLSSMEASAPRSSSFPNPLKKTTLLGPDLDTKLPLIRKEYDLRPYGVGIVIDFGWKR